MNTLTNTYFEDLYKGRYNFNQLKEDPEIKRRIHNLFTTAWEAVKNIDWKQG